MFYLGDIRWRLHVHHLYSFLHYQLLWSADNYGLSHPSIMFAPCFHQRLMRSANWTQQSTLNIIAHWIEWADHTDNVIGSSPSKKLLDALLGSLPALHMNCTTPSNTMQFHAIKLNLIQYDAIPCNTMQWNTIKYHAIHNTQLNTIQCHAKRWNTMKYHAIQ